MSAEVTFIDNPEQRSSLVWAMFYKKVVHGEELKESLIWAIRNGAILPTSHESLNLIADVLEGKHATKRGKGRPQKQAGTNLTQFLVEDGIVEAYRNWRAAFRRDRELAWLRYEAQRLRREKPDAAVWRLMNDLGTEEGRRSFAMALADLGALPCPRTGRGAEPPRELALKATARQCGPGWESIESNPLTPATVARVLTRAKKSQ
jgi:hypothetical protein